MTDIIDKSEFNGIPLLDLTEPVKGGLDGPANKQAIELANRTRYLLDNTAIHVPSWEALSTTEGEENKLVNLLSYHEDLGYGGGNFIGRSGSKVTDNGTVCQVSDSFYWERIIHNHGELDVTHFGAIKDGLTDSMPACLSMHNWSLGLKGPYAFIGIQFPAGVFAISNTDLSATYVSKFRFAGINQVKFGYYACTRIVLIGDNVPAFTLQARWVEVSDVVIYGQTDVADNQRGFLKNITESGEYVHAVNWRAEYVGGTVFDLLDTLDTKFEEFYSTNCTGTLIKGNYSSNEQGSWDHITAVQLSNFNIQSQKGPNPALYLPNSTQSLIINGWIEKCEYPGVMTNGQWLIDQLSIEACTNPFDMTYNKAIVRALNLQSGSSINWDNSEVHNANPFASGRSFFEAHGIKQYGSLAYNYLHSNMRWNNPTDNPVWIYVGDYSLTTRQDIVKFRVIGGHGVVSGSDKGFYGSSNNGGGELEVSLRYQPVAGKQQDGNCVVTGTNPLQDIGFQRPYDGMAKVYIQLPPQSGWVNCYFETTAHSRFTAGTPFHFIYNGSIVPDAEMPTLYRPRKTASWGTQDYGLTIMEDGVIHATTKQITADGKMPVNVNGIYYAVPLDKYPYLSDSFNRVGTIFRPLDNAYGGIINGNWNNWGIATGGAAVNNGVFNYTYKGSNAIVGLNTQLDNAEISFILVSGPNNTIDEVATAFEFRRAGYAGLNGAYLLSFKGKTNTTNNVALLRRDVAEDGTVTYSDMLSGDININDGQKITISYNDSTIKIYADTDLIGSVTDGSYQTGQYVGWLATPNNSGISVSKFIVTQA